MSEQGAGRPVVLLAADGASTRIVYHALRKEHPALQVVLEEPVSRALLLRRRRAKLGTAAVLGQLMFMAGVVPLLRRAAGGRIARILAEHGLDDSEIGGPVHRVASVNAPETRALLQRLDPSVVVVNGTRIIGRDTLRSVAAPFINTHSGITPLYRGVHGGFWALHDGRPELVGTTIHLVDEGIDTGRVVEQVTFQVTPEDSFATYPYLHIAVALPALLRAVRGAAEGRLKLADGPPALESRLRSHPTLRQYLGSRIMRGVR